MSLIDDIAKRVGVSPRTVTHVLAGKNKEVWPSTRKRADRIRQVAAELGYRPNAAARATRTGRFGQVALLQSTDQSRSYQLPNIVDIVHDALAECHLHLVYARMPDTTLNATAKVPQVLRELRVDGLLVNIRYGIPEALERQIMQQEVPTVWMGALREADAVLPDDEGAGYDLTRRLIAQGHRRILFADLREDVNELSSDRPAPICRRRGYARAMDEAGLQAMAVGPNLGEAQLAALLCAASFPTAVVGVDATHYARLSNLVTAAGRRPGTDVMITGFTNRLELGRHAHLPQMVTQHEQVAERAAIELHKRIEQPGYTFAPIRIPSVFHEGVPTAG